MRNRIVQSILKILAVLAGLTLGITFSTLIIKFLPKYFPKLSGNIYVYILIYAVICSIFSFNSIIIFNKFNFRFQELTSIFEQNWDKMNGKQIIASSFGLIAGFLVAALFSQLLTYTQNHMFSFILGTIIYILFGYLGFKFAYKKSNEIFSSFKNFMVKKPFKKYIKANSTDLKYEYIKPKILDTSVLIDGRICDIAKTGFIEGTLIVTQGTLKELQYISDSSDTLRRNKGRRGLDIVAKIIEELGNKVQINDIAYNDIVEVDAQLIRLAKDINAVIITNDYNLNKLAGIEGIGVLNLNDLANAVKPMLMQNEQIQVQVIKDGKEPGQGVAYMEDGTMIVIDGGRDYTGKTINVIVTSVLQSSAGRMIFAKVP